MKSTLFYRFAEYTLVAAVGGVGYYSLEVMFRGWSHFSMAICGALCFALYYALCTTWPKIPLLLRALCGAVIITVLELIFGVMVNLVLGWQVWDYSHLPLNLWGQITPVFSTLWFLLCIPAATLCRLLQRWVFSDAEHA